MLGLSVIILFKSLLHVFCSLVFSAHNSSVIAIEIFSDLSISTCGLYLGSTGNFFKKKADFGKRMAGNIFNSIQFNIVSNFPQHSHSPCIKSGIQHRVASAILVSLHFASSGQTSGHASGQAASSQQLPAPPSPPLSTCHELPHFHVCAFSNCPIPILRLPVLRDGYFHWLLFLFRPFHIFPQPMSSVAAQQVVIKIRRFSFWSRICPKGKRAEIRTNLSSSLLI